MFYSTRVVLRLFPLLCWAFLVFPFLGLCAGYDVTFHNIGQGNCTVVKSPSKKILVIDAGSSNTNGVPGVPPTGKYEFLAKKVVDSVKGDLDGSKWLWFVVSHPDKDHLNLVKKMIEQSGLIDERTKSPCSGCSVGVLLGGERNIYKTIDSRTLIGFLSSYNIPHFFGQDDYQAQPRPGVFYEPREKPSPILAGWEGRIDFLSVDGNLGASTKVVKKRTVVSAFEDKPLAGTFVESDSKKSGVEADSSGGLAASGAITRFMEQESEDDDTNKVSIVMKVHCGDFSVMLTGDKTSRETNLIIKRFRGKESDLRSDILLATHHGSSTDYVEEWVKLVDPVYVVFSAGRSFDHPRSFAFHGYFMNAKRLGVAPWHFVQFQGDFITDNAGFLKSIFRETPSSIEKARGYVHASTNRSIFVTGNQGDVSFGSDGVRVSTRMFDDEISALIGFFSCPEMIDGSPLKIEEVTLHEMPAIGPVLSHFVRNPSFEKMKRLSMTNCKLNDDHSALVINLIRKNEDLIFLDLRGHEFSTPALETLQRTWGYRGLST